MPICLKASQSCFIHLIHLNHSLPAPPPTTLPFPNHPSICSGSPNPTRSWWDTIQVEGAQQAIIPAGKIPTQDMFENDVPSFLFPFGGIWHRSPGGVSYSLTSRDPSLVVLPFCSENHEKVPLCNLPGHAAFTLVDLGVKRCMRLSNQTLALRDSQFAAEN